MLLLQTAASKAGCHHTAHVALPAGPPLMPPSTRLLQDKSSTASNMKIAALQFLRLGMQSTGAAIWQQHVPKLAGLVAASAEQRYYKVSAEALRVIAAMVLVIRPQGSTAPAAELKVGLLT